MEYKYYDQKDNRIKHKNIVEAAKDLNVYKVETINDVARQTYIRTGAGWKPEQTKKLTK